MKYILLIGPVTNVKAGLIGGATVSFGCLIDFFHQTQEHFTLINTQKYPTGFKRYLNPFYILFKVLTNASNADVLFLNSSRGGTKYLAPLLFVLSRLYKTKFVFRPFGGNIKDYTAQYTSVQKWWFKNTVLKADILFLQTKKLLQFYANKKANVVYFPTSRDSPPPAMVKNRTSYKKRFVYLGNISTSKGIDQILAAADILDAAYIIHLYGPLTEQKYKAQFERKTGLYKGVLAKEEVLPVLNEYDVLLLPTFYEGEGYPGVIIEAYALGIPVITTHWKSIPEIVAHGKTGQLIEPKSISALVNAMKSFETSNYPKYSQNSRNYFLDSFRTDEVLKKVMREIKQLDF